jgi:hypothetical protein
MPKKLTNVEFLERSFKIHKNKYDYLECYKNSTTKIKIRCKKHDYIFEQSPNKHLIGRGCPICGRNIINEKLEQYIKDFSQKENYDYSLNDFSQIYSVNNKIKIRCKKHDYVFDQFISEHKKGKGCKKCAIEYTSNIIRHTFEDFLRKANIKHNSKFKYKYKELKNNNDTVVIICREHGEFQQKVCKHLRSKIACPECKKLFLRKKRIEEIRLNNFNGNQVFPNFNPVACDILNKISEKTGNLIKHAMNGGEFYIKELGYWVDGYDKENNIVYEIDEKKHFDKDGNLKEKDIKRQKEIMRYLNCEFKRIKI